MKNPFFLLPCILIASMTAASAADLKVDKGKSRVQVDAKATGHSFTGTLADYTVSASGDTDTEKPTSFSLKWDFEDLKTADEKRDKEMIKWLGGGKPKGSFVFTKTWTNGKGATFAEGKLTIHGVSKTISFPYTVKRDGGWVTVDGTARLDYQDFSLPVIRAMAVMTVDPALIVRFHIVGQLN